MGDSLGTPSAAEKNQSRAPLLEHVSQADGCQTLSRCTRSGKVWTVFQTACLRACLRLQQCSSLEYWPLEWGPTVWEYDQIL